MSDLTRRFLIAATLAVAILLPVGHGVLRDLADNATGPPNCIACAQTFVRCPSCRGLKLGVSWPAAKCSTCGGTGYCHPGGICQVPWPD